MFGYIILAGLGISLICFCYFMYIGLKHKDEFALNRKTDFLISICCFVYLYFLWNHADTDVLRIFTYVLSAFLFGDLAYELFFHKKKNKKTYKYLVCYVFDFDNKIGFSIRRYTINWTKKIETESDVYEVENYLKDSISAKNIANLVLCSFQLLK